MDSGKVGLNFWKDLKNLSFQPFIHAGLRAVWKDNSLNQAVCRRFGKIFKPIFPKIFPEFGKIAIFPKNKNLSKPFIYAPSQAFKSFQKSFLLCARAYFTWKNIYPKRVYIFFQRKIVWKDTNLSKAKFYNASPLSPSGRLAVKLPQKKRIEICKVEINRY